MKRGLTKAYVISEAIRLVEEEGYEKISLRDLSRRLDVKPASLYNHISGIGEILREVAIYSAEQMCLALKAATEGKEKREAFVDGALAYRRFATEHPELYKAFISMPSLDDSEVDEVGIKSFAPLRDLIYSYLPDEKDSTNFHRAFRSVIHGFIELTTSGYMTRGNVSQDDTFLVILNTYLSYLESMAASVYNSQNIRGDESARQTVAQISVNAENGAELPTRVKEKEGKG